MNPTLAHAFTLFMIAWAFQIVISIYEVVNIIITGQSLSQFQPWARYLIVINTLLVVINSSSNFAFYCGDVVFRECLSAISCGAPLCRAISERLRNYWNSNMTRQPSSTSSRTTHDREGLGVKDESKKSRANESSVEKIEVILRKFSVDDLRIVEQRPK